jgi:hypothetical protein
MRTARKLRTPVASAPPGPMPPELIGATVHPDIVEVPPRTVLSIEGTGAPEGEAFPRSLQALYGVTYTLRFARRKLGRDFKIGPLEALWWTDEPDRTLPETPRPAWRWRLRLAVPDNAADQELAEVVSWVVSKKRGKLRGSAEVKRVRVERLPATRFGRVLHVGPYGEEAASFARLRAALGAEGLTGTPSHIEIYMNDPRRTAPQRLKTVLLLQIAEQGG